MSYKQNSPIEKQVLSQTSTEQIKARICLEKIVTSICFLAKQGLSFRGHDSDSENLFELINLRCDDSLELKQWMARNKKKLIHNEILYLLSNEIVYKICTEICSQNRPIFSIICDGTRDISGEEQLSVCFRWVDKGLCPHESFVGLYSVGKTTDEYNYRLCSSRRHDKASATNVKFTSNVLNHQSLALYVHCGAHCVNLMIRDDCNSSITVKNSLDWAHELGVLLSQSLHAKKQLRPSFRAAVLVVQGNQINEMIERYEEILATLEDLKSQDKAACLLRVIEDSSTFLGGTKQTTSGLIDAVNIIYFDLNNSRNEDAFKKIFEEATRKSQERNLLPLTLQKQKHTPKRLLSPATDCTPESCEAHYRMEYFSIIDSALVSLKTRFDQEGLKKAEAMEKLMTVSVGEIEKNWKFNK
ncbi:hypothetical protein PR048_015748 [Dryococelus australis]|uniref:DUF4371 domain-containing protein n=1 Tax=Dryococelus australis TaxID=614101 RepID=A0ABQ9HHU8_9NEOP|nr:hypothetical protein PR048_015748 [Dryococelus australis]